MAVAVFQCAKNSLLHGRADGRSHAGKEEDINAGKQCLPVKIVCVCLSQGASGPVIEDTCGADIASFFKEIDAKPRAAPQNAGGRTSMQ